MGTGLVSPALIANAANETTTLVHLVLHALPAGEKLAGKDHVVPHWDYKDRAADKIKQSLPGLAAKTTFLWLGWFASNFYNTVLTKPVEIVGYFLAAENECQHHRLTYPLTAPKRRLLRLDPALQALDLHVDF